MEWREESYDTKNAIIRGDTRCGISRSSLRCHYSLIQSCRRGLSQSPYRSSLHATYSIDLFRYKILHLDHHLKIFWESTLMRPGARFGIARVIPLIPQARKINLKWVITNRLYVETQVEGFRQTVIPSPSSTLKGYVNACTKHNPAL
ncbi:hypothetical protein J6590_039811 [Homalodisca vitripennis]|nr:hypothetical protein J6590_039811 [Homalodisca vitripennis]